MILNVFLCISFGIKLIYLILILFIMSTKTQTKTKTVSALAGKIQVENILQLSLVQSTLQANFKAILQALSEHQGTIEKNKDDNQNNSDKLSKVESSNDKMNKQISNLKEMIDKLNKQNADMKTKVSAIEQKLEPNPESSQSKKDSVKLQDLNKQLLNIRQKIDKVDDKFQKNSEMARLDIDKLKKQLNQMKKLSDTTINNNLKLKQLEKLLKQMQDKNNQISKNLSSLKNDFSASGGDNILEKLRELNQKLQNLKQSHQDHESRITQLEKQVLQNKNILQQQRRLRSKLSQQMWKLHDAFSKISQNNLTTQMNNDTVKQMRKQLTDLQKRISDMSGLSKNAFNDTTIHQSPSKIHGDSPSKGQTGDLREQLHEKLKLLRADLMKNMRKLDIKNQGDIGMDKNRLDSIDQAILRLDHLLADKANLDTVKKLIYNIENKINYIYNMFLGESEEDATIARRNWFCLSCDRKLDKYQGKLGHHLVNSQLKTKTLQQDTVGGGMVLKSAKSKLDLPKVTTTNIKKL